MAARTQDAETPTERTTRIGVRQRRPAGRPLPPRVPAGVPAWADRDRRGPPETGAGQAWLRPYASGGVLYTSKNPNAKPPP